MNDPTAESVHEKVGRVTVAESQDMAYHGHDSKRSAVVTSSVEPGFRVSTLEPHDAVEVLPGRVVQRVLEDLELLHEAKVVEVGRHLGEERVSGSTTR